MTEPSKPLPAVTIDEDPGLPPPDVIDAFLKDCICCDECADRPCSGIMAGGLCDRMCRCEPDYDAPDHRGDRWPED